MLDGAAKEQLANTAAHKALFDRALFQFSINDNTMGVRRYWARAAKKV
jgi:hypothetical protein